MTETPRPLAVLGLSDDASSEDIRKAYRRLALRYHPDRNPGDAEAAAAFHAVREAYEALDISDPDAGYDAERVVREMQQAAAEAARRRGGAMDAGRTWQIARFDLDRPRPGGLLGAARTPTGLAGLGLAVGALAAAVLGPATWVWVAAAVATAGAALVAWAARTDDPGPAAVETHWQGLRDLRWDVLLSWAEIRGVREVDGGLALAVTAGAAERLASVAPADALPEAGVYRLPLRDAAPLAAIVRANLDR